MILFKTESFRLKHMIMLIMFCLCSCNQGTSSRTSTEQIPQADKHIEKCEISFIDAAGRAVILTGTPGRIAVVGRGPFMALHLLYMFQEINRILVGLEERNKSASFLPLVDKDFYTKTILQPNPGPEQVATLKPDVVIMKGSVEEHLAISLEKLGIPVVYLGMETPEQFLKDVENIGIILGNPSRAEQIKAFYTSRMEMIRDRLEDIKVEQKPKVLVVSYNERGGKYALQVPAASWMQSIQAVIAGARAVWIDSTSVTDGWTILNFEQIALWNPDMIFVIISHNLEPHDVITSLEQDPQWAMLKAAREKKIMVFPSDMFGWDSPEPRWILGMIWMAKKIWPGRFDLISMREQVYTFFEQLYFLDRTVIDREIMQRTYGI